jgi:RNA 2',3'-cyclic 3'-phosphodiesterase
VSDRVRCFIAIDVPPEVKKKIDASIIALKSLQADVRWVKPESMHLTLKFLGHIETTKLDEVKERLPHWASSMGAFSFSLSSWDQFPQKGMPRVLWLGIKEGKDKLCLLAQEIEKGCLALGFSPEVRDLSPHLTVGRVKGDRNIQKLTEVLRNEKFTSQKVAADHLTLYESKLTSEGAQYRVISSAEL